jgi:hypothetical protein
MPALQHIIQLISSASWLDLLVNTNYCYCAALSALAMLLTCALALSRCVCLRVLGCSGHTYTSTDGGTCPSIRPPWLTAPLPLASLMHQVTAFHQLLSIDMVGHVPATFPHADIQVGLGALVTMRMIRRCSAQLLGRSVQCSHK